MKYIIYQLHDFRTLGWYKKKKEENPTYTDTSLKSEWYTVHQNIPLIIADKNGYVVGGINKHTISGTSDGIYDIWLTQCSNMTRICIRTPSIILCNIRFNRPLSEYRIRVGDANGYSFIPPCGEKLTIELNEGAIADLYVGTVMVTQAALREIDIYNKNRMFQVCNKYYMVRHGKYVKYRRNVLRLLCGA